VDIDGSLTAASAQVSLLTVILRGMEKQLSPCYEVAVAITKLSSHNLGKKKPNRTRS
jgi:hypothetical protein